MVSRYFQTLLVRRPPYSSTWNAGIDPKARSERVTERKARTMEWNDMASRAELGAATLQTYANPAETVDRSPSRWTVNI